MYEEFMKGKKVVVRPNPNKKSLLGYRRIEGKDAQGKDYDVEEVSLTRAPGTRNTIMPAPAEGLNGYLNTGLQHMMANPYKDDKKFKSKQWEEILKDKDEILIQHYMEYRFNKALDYYSNKIEHQRVIDKLEQIKFNFWQSELAAFEFSDGATVLDLDKERDLVQYFWIKSDPMFANSYSEISHLTAYFIESEHEEETRKAEKSKVVDLTLAKLVEADTSEDSDLIKKLAKVLNIRAKGLKKEKVYQEISAKIKANKDSFVQEFNYAFNLWKEPATRIQFNAKAFLVDLIDYGIITQRGMEYTWTPPSEDGSNDTVKWFGREEVLEFLTEKKFQPQRELLEKQLTSKR